MPATPHVTTALTHCEVDPALRHLAPEGLARTFSMVPFATAGEVVLVAAVDADDAVAAHVLADRLGRPVELVAHTEAAVRRALEAAYPPPPTTDETPRQRRQRLRLGQVLLRNGLVENAALEAGYAEHLAYLPATDETRDETVELGEVLVARGAISEEALVAVLSELHDLQRVTVAGVDVPGEVRRLLPLDLAVRARAVPVAARGEEVVVAAARPLDAATTARVREALGRPVTLVLAAAPEVERLLLATYERDLVDRARTGPAGRLPDRAATSRGHHAVVLVSLGLVGLVAGAVVLWTATAALVLAVALLAATALVGLHRAVLVGRALRPAPTGAPGAGGAAGDGCDKAAPEIDADPAVPAGSLPRCSVLVTVRQVVSLPGLLASLDALDYPRSRLEVLLLCEESDVEVRRAVAHTPLPAHVRAVVVPDSVPLTPAKARNLALPLTRGDLVCALEDVDRPEPQLLRSVAARLAADPDLACVQARLQHEVGDGAGLVAGWAAGALSVRSALWAPAAAAGGGVLLLGETGHLVRRAVLEHLGGWDPTSLTPGAELGLRLRRAGHRAGVVAATVWSPAPRDARTWLSGSAARSHGLALTSLLHARAPHRLLSDLGARRLPGLALHALAGLGQLLSPLLLLGALAWLTTRAAGVEAGPDAVALLGLTCLVVVLVAALGSAYLVLASTLRLRRHDLVRPALLAPVSWVLLSLAPLLPRRAPGAATGLREVCP